MIRNRLVGGVLLQDIKGVTLKGIENLFKCLLYLIILHPAFTSNQIMAQDRVMEVEDIMEFRHISNAGISQNGDLVSYERAPDRGDGSVHVVDDAGREQLHIARGTSPELSSDGNWLMTMVCKPYREQLRETGPADSLVVIRTDRSDTLMLGGIERAVFSQDSRWLAVLTVPEQEAEEGKRTPPGGHLSLYSLEDGFGARLDGEADSSSEGNSDERRHRGSDDRETGFRRSVFETGSVRALTMDSLSTHLVYTVVDSTGERNGLYRVALDAASLHEEAIHRQRHAVYDGLSWHEKRRRLAFLFSREDDFGNPSPSTLHVWDAGEEELEQLVTSDLLSENRVLPLHSSLTWSEDGNRLFFGWQPRSMYRLSRYVEEEDKFAITDRDTILADAGVDIWHGQDPLIKTNEKNTWQERRDHTYLAVFHVNRNRIVELADERVPYVEPVDNPRYALGSNPRPYKREITWDGRYSDYHIIDLQDGSRTEIIDRLRSTTVSQSPDGRYVLFYESENWHLFDADRNTIRNITESINVPFYNEDHDYPYPVPGYGMAGWVEGDRAVLIYDKYDIWQIDTRSETAYNLTGGDGRSRQRQYRVVPTDPDRDAFQRNEHLLVRGFGERDKTYGFYGIRTGREGIERFTEGPYRYEFIAAGRNSNRILYTRESYREFPDLWMADRRLRSPQKLTDVNPQIGDFDWGRAQLVRWLDQDGEELDGVLITPDNYEEGERIPVLVYFYEQFSQRLHHFNEQVINHRPSFPYYVSNGYAVFLPDVRYDVGIPGYSATRSIVPGVTKLIDMGIADPDAIALHGHSWSGYQAAHMATQTHIFAAVIAGAPVSNMTSAYSGIRWGTGLARQFQYEQTQSRIGGSLWEMRERYIENSPVFYADRIRTPMLIMFGDEDEAVPWEQGIELYLAMRRLHKDVIFLQYRGEPHHPQEYANKLDYFLRMKEYLDHHLKGDPAADWIREGVPYIGE